MAEAFLEPEALGQPEDGSAALDFEASALEAYFFFFVLLLVKFWARRGWRAAAGWHVSMMEGYEHVHALQRTARNMIWAMFDRTSLVVLSRFVRASPRLPGPVMQ